MARYISSRRAAASSFLTVVAVHCYGMLSAVDVSAGEISTAEAEGGMFDVFSLINFLRILGDSECGRLGYVTLYIPPSVA